MIVEQCQVNEAMAVFAQASSSIVPGQPGSRASTTG